MYKILYLPSGTDLLINVNFCRAVILETMIPWENEYGLCIPDTPYVTGHKYKIAIFESPKAAKSWLIDLLQRNSIQSKNMRLEHFEIVEII